MSTLRSPVGGGCQHNISNTKLDQNTATNTHYEAQETFNQNIQNQQINQQPNTYYYQHLQQANLQNPQITKQQNNQYYSMQNYQNHQQNLNLQTYKQPDTINPLAFNFIQSNEFNNAPFQPCLPHLRNQITQINNQTQPIPTLTPNNTQNTFLGILGEKFTLGKLIKQTDGISRETKKDYLS